MTGSRILRLCFVIRRQLEPTNLYLTGMPHTCLIGYETIENNEITLSLGFCTFSLVNGVIPKFLYYLTLKRYMFSQSLKIKGRLTNRKLCNKRRSDVWGGGGILLRRLDLTSKFIKF